MQGGKSLGGGWVLQDAWQEEEEGREKLSAGGGGGCRGNVAGWEETVQKTF